MEGNLLEIGPWAHGPRRLEWESEIRATFAKRWIERIPAGWYYQDASGVWVRKA